MNEESMQLLLRVLAGPNAGGEVLLADGECVVGSGDACDVVLADAAVSERHLALAVKGAQVRASVLDGSLYLSGDPFYGGELDYFVPLALGSTHVAVGPAGGAWPEILLATPSKLAENGDDDHGDTSAGSGSAEGQAARDADGTESSGATEQTVNKESAKDISAREKKVFLAGAVGVVLLALILLLLVRTFGTQPTKLALPNEVVAERATKTLNELGYEDIRVQAENGMATLTGYVPTRKDRRRLASKTRELGFPVRVRVRDGEALAEGLRQSLAMAGLNLGVVYSGPGRLTVQGYAADRQTVEAALKTALRDVPGVQGVDLNLLTARDAVRELAAAARKQGLGRRVSVAAYPGYILAKGRLSGDQLDAWARAKEPVMRRYGGHVDLREQFSGAVRRAPKYRGASGLVAQSLRRVGMEINTPAPRNNAAPIVASNGASASGPRASGRSASGPRLSVQSVSLGAARFMTLKNGKRYFEGGRLPSGYVIRKIQADRIILAKGSATVTHRIGGM